MSPQTQQPRQKVSFPTNTPTSVVLEFNPPTEPRAGRFGDQYMYFLAGDQIMFVDPPVHQAIVNADAIAGDEIMITKRETRAGNARRITWEVGRVEGENEPTVPEPQPVAARIQPPAPTKVTTAGEMQQPAPAANTSVQQTRTGSESREMFSALMNSIDAAALAEQYAREKGLAIRFTSEDVRTMANALMMRAERQVR